MTTLAGLPVQGLREALAHAADHSGTDSAFPRPDARPFDFDETLAGNTDASGIQITYIMMASSVAAAEAVCADVGPSRCKGVFAHIKAAPIRVDLAELSSVIIEHFDNLTVAVADQVVHVAPPIADADGPVEGGTGIAAATWGLNRINKDSAPAAGYGAHVYVLDTGVRCTHTQFEGRCVPTLESLGTLRPCECLNYTCATDTRGHGTHCAGTIAAVDYGVAPQTTIHAVKVLGDDGYGYTSWSIAAEAWILANGERPAIVSMSLGGSGNNYAEKVSLDALIADGVPVVVAAGNEVDDACNYDPAWIPGVITVGSTTSSDGLSSFSNYGPCVDILAPGSSVLSAGQISDTATYYNSGTSMACPHVAGAASILLALNPLMTPAQILAELCSLPEDPVAGLGVTFPGSRRIQTKLKSHSM